MQLTNPAGAPAFSAACCKVRAVSLLQLIAEGWGATIIASLAFTAEIAFAKTVEVGLVLGVRAATTPIGQAIS